LDRVYFYPGSTDSEKEFQTSPLRRCAAALLRCCAAAGCGHICLSACEAASQRGLACRHSADRMGSACEYLPVNVTPKYL
jgi:hypothetical protein